MGYCLKLDSDIDSLYKNLQTAEAQRKEGETDYQARLKELEEVTTIPFLSHSHTQQLTACSGRRGVIPFQALVSLQALDADEMTRWMDEVIAREAISTR